MTAEEEGAMTVQGDEPHAGSVAGRLRRLRAGVLGANDGIVSVAAIVAGATAATAPVLTAGAAGLVGGAISMALGEYVSVSSQRDSQTALIAKEREELRTTPEQEFDELAGLYQAKGLSRATAMQVAQELTARDALAAHLEAELGTPAGEWDLLQAVLGTADEWLLHELRPTTMSRRPHHAHTSAVSASGSAIGQLQELRPMRSGTIRTCVDR